MQNLASVHVALLAASSSSKTSAGSSAVSFIFILLLVLLAYVFFIRPRSAQARRQRQNLQEVSVGDEVLTGAGIFGRVLDVEPDRITIETAPGTRITVLRSTIARRIEPTDEPASWDEHPDSGTDHSGDGRPEALGAGGTGNTADNSHAAEEEHSGGEAAAGGEGGRS